MSNGINARIIDWESMKSGASGIAKRNYLLYGASSVGNRVLYFLRTLGLEKQIVAVVDSNEAKWGVDWCGYEVESPSNISKYPDDVLIIISSTYVKEIVEMLQACNYKNDMIGSTAFRLSFHYDLLNGNTDYLLEKSVDEYKIKYELWCDLLGADTKNARIKGFKSTLRVLMIQSPSILIHGIQKTGNKTLEKTFDKMYNAAFTEHSVYRDDTTLRQLKNVLDCFHTNEIKIITGVREPIERIISGKWQDIRFPYFNDNKCISTIVDENYDAFCDIATCNRCYEDVLCYADPEKWFDDQIKIPFGIDVFDYPFDKEKGYSVIKKDNISVFVYRLDKLNSLTEELGHFVGIENGFELKRDNSAADKAYHFAYKDYLKEVKIKKDFFEQLMTSKAVTHFYTEEQCMKMRQKWEESLIDL